MSSRPISRRILTLSACAALVAGGGATIALASGADPAAPPPAKSLDRAVADAVSAPAPAGVTARVTLKNDLPPALLGKAAQAPSVFRGAEGRVWMGEDRIRADLKATDGERVQLVVDAKRFWFYDSASNRVARGTLPDAAGMNGPSVKPGPEAIRRLVALVQQHAAVSEPEPGSFAGRPSYSVDVRPRGVAGLGHGELTWDAERAIPLRAAVYLGASDTAAFEVRADEVRFGAVPESTFDVEPPASADVVEVPSRR